MEDFMNEKLLNVKEVSEYLNVSRSCIYHYIKEKVIPVIRFNGRVVFSQQDIDLWIESNKQQVKEVSK